MLLHALRETTPAYSEAGQRWIGAVVRAAKKIQPMTEVRMYRACSTSLTLRTNLQYGRLIRFCEFEPTDAPIESIQGIV